MRKIILEKKVNGYDMVVVESESRMDVIVANWNNDFDIFIDDYLGMMEHLRNKAYSLIQFKIQTTSFGSQTVVEVEQLIEKYQKAIDAVKVFEEALQELEILEMREAQ